jgi:Zn-dependent protease
VAVLVVLAVGPLFANGPDRFAGLMFLAALSVQLFGHELGHLVAAAAVGYRPRWLSAGPLIVRVEGGRTRLTRSRSWWMFFGGYAAYEPLGRTRAKDLVVIAAGPLANLLLAEAARETWGWPTDSTVVSLFLRALIGLGIALAVLNLMPLPRTAGGLALDGRELLDLLRRRF